VQIARNRLEGTLQSKLQMRIDTKRDHRFFELYVDDQWVLQTKVSTGTKYRELGDALLAQIATQLKVSKRQLTDLVNCPMGYDEYIEHLRMKGVLD
jgi:hypothetical protein